ncbi:uncharacterized protein LOC128242963 isoform X2 [Mya arenaria]|uniref:uncharacterized protein LOC128242963 isoform X2 n=1 Tax=Mya arenaria TaxID=6604 RepID=UPI0022E226B5|nr:uncharacterized protein LOC128242963 isoform X2 [Mya arenaria]
MILLWSCLLSSFTVLSGQQTYHVTFLHSPGTASITDVNLGNIKLSKQNYLNANDGTYTLSANACEVNATVSVGSSLHTKVLTMMAPNCSGVIPAAVGVSPSGMRLTVEDNVVVHVNQYSHDDSDWETYLAIPDKHLGSEYYVLTYCAMGGFCQMAITPVEDQTSVTIFFRNGVENMPNCASGSTVLDPVHGTGIPLTLNEGEVFHLESTVDLSGTYIVSDKNITVIVGGRKIPAKVNGDNGIMTTQLPPVNRWGTDFIVIPNTMNNAGDLVKIITQANHTEVYISGFSPFVIPKAGSAIVRRLDWGMSSVIQTSSPVMILQVMSIDLYNDSTAVVGSPSMLIIPSRKHWKPASSLIFPCNSGTELDSFVLTVTKGNITPGSTTTIQEYQMLDFNIQNNMRVSSDPEGPYQLISNDSVLAYGYCRHTSAYLLDVDWTHVTQNCKRSRSLPGDQVDNDCDGAVDEDTCTPDDLYQRFTVARSDNTNNFYVVGVEGWTTIPFHVQLNPGSIVSLSVVGDEDNGVPLASIIITETSVWTETCSSPPCNTETITPNDMIFTIVVDQTASDTTLDFSASSSNTFTFKTLPAAQPPKYIVVSSLEGKADFKFDIHDKDCSKVYSGDADGLGQMFVVPCNSGNKCEIYVNTADTNAINLTKPDGTQLPVTCETDGSWIRATLQSDIPTDTTMLLLQATVEVSVFALINDTSGQNGVKLIPVDVAGPAYHILPNTTCTVYAHQTELHWRPGDQAQVDVQTYSTKSGSTADPSTAFPLIIRAYEPMLVFCGTPETIGVSAPSVQIPPRDTLGKHHFIPRLSVVVWAKLSIITSADSTVVTIKGDYHKLDTFNAAPGIHTRVMVLDMLYEIEASKPVQVHLHLQTPAARYHEIIVPATDKYNPITSSQLPGSASSVLSVGVDANGTHYSNSTPTAPVFWLYMFDLNNQRYVLQNDQKYHTTNDVCELSDQLLSGDGKDNDCDGLADEEGACAMSTAPGSVDPDIDGALYEDCLTGTVPTSTISLGVDSTDVQCSTGGGVGGEFIDNFLPVSVNSSTLPVTETSTPASPPPILEDTYPELPIPTTNAGASAMFSTSTSSSSRDTSANATTAEECMQPCYCPCGWVEPKNYTTAEIQQKVAEIQAKLKVPVKDLSATRKLISAPDYRTAAKAIGYVGVAFLVVSLGSIFLLDVPTLLNDAKMLVENMRNVFPR